MLRTRLFNLCVIAWPFLSISISHWTAFPMYMIHLKLQISWHQLNCYSTCLFRESFYQNFMQNITLLKIQSYPHRWDGIDDMKFLKSDNSTVKCNLHSIRNKNFQHTHTFYKDRECIYLFSWLHWKPAKLNTMSLTIARKIYFLEYLFLQMPPAGCIFSWEIISPPPLLIFQNHFELQKWYPDCPHSNTTLWDQI